MIVEDVTKDPIALLSKERYDYYRECERKSKLTDKEIHRLASEQFKEWAENTKFTVELKYRNLLGSLNNGSTFITQWLMDTWYNNEKLKDPTFVFEKSLNDSICHIADSIYAEHLKELRNEYISKYSKRQKAYDRLCWITGISWVLSLLLIILLIFFK